MENHGELIIALRPSDVLNDLKKAYEQPEEKGMPPQCDHIVLTLEPFIGTAGNNFDTIEDIRSSVEYWRRFVPRDGMPLDEVLALSAINWN